MNKLFLFSILFYCSTTFSQAYFQQKVNYKINVTLNDKNNTLSAYEEFTYFNQSPNQLDYIYIHVWPNAYKNTETALAHQLIRMKNMNLEDATEEGRGYIDSLDFKINGEKALWSYDSEHIDIVKLTLNAPLKSGEAIIVSTPFKVKIPSGSISRLGHVGESFQITQWYPKPAVYDKNGWHQMPYLTQGEFYSEFGEFDVSITLPKNYVVGATGDLQTKSEIDFLNGLNEKTKQKFIANKFDYTKKNGSGKSPFPESDSIYKTIRYIQQNVHDFGWFADKRFEVLKGEIELPHSKRKVTTWAMFVPHHATLWENAIEYINDGTYYYSKWNGDYQYNQVTAVDGTISAGGGMEYPNVTVIGNAKSKIELEVVIVHEVGHNWFYGMLGSNERDHPWMDEGLNTLNELRYIETKYPNNTQVSDKMGELAETIHLEHLGHHDMSDLTYSITAGFGLDQPIELKSDDYTLINYGGIVYSKTGLVFTYLKDYLGNELFDDCMQNYFNKWHFKHPQPNDLRQALEEISGKNLSWLFEEIIPTTRQIDYKISKVKLTEKQVKVTVKNVGQVNGPIKVEAYSMSKLKEVKWVEPNRKKTTINFEGNDIDEIKIDGEKRIPETNRNNNNWRKQGVFGKIEPINFEFLFGDNESDRTTIWVAPMLAFNAYDKLMLGMAIHNYTLPKNKFEYFLAPMFSFGRNSISGFGSLRYSIVPVQNFQSVIFGLKARNFGFDTNDGNSNYVSVSPYIKFLIGKPKQRTNYSQSLKIQGTYNFEDGINYQKITGGFSKYEFNFKKKNHTFIGKTRIDYIKILGDNAEVMNVFANALYKVMYWKEKKKHISFSLNFGKNIFYRGTNDSRYGIALSGQNGTQDVFYESFRTGRNETSGISAQTLSFNHGAFNSVSNLTTKNQLITGSVYFELPYMPIGLFSDFGMIPKGNETENFIQIGIGIRKLEGLLGIYVPLFESNTLKETHIENISTWKKIRFTINLSELTPNKVIKMVM